MLKRGMNKHVYFDNDQVKRIRKYFNELDSDMSGMVSANEIEEMLISLGLTNSKEEVSEMVK